MPASITVLPLSWVCRLSAELCIVAKQFGIDLWCVMKSNRNMGVNLSIAAIFSPWSSLTPKRIKEIELVLCGASTAKVINARMQ